MPHRALVLSCAALCLAMTVVRADEPLICGLNPKEVVPRTNYEFRLAGLDTELSMAVFHFRWKGTQPVEFSTYTPQDGTTFEAQFAEYCYLAKTKWMPLGLGYCGTGSQAQIVKPNIDYVIKVGLPFLPSEKAPENVPRNAEKVVIGLPIKSDKGSGFVLSDEIPLPQPAVVPASH